MKKYDTNQIGDPVQMDDGLFYLVTDADARIEQLERALRSCLLVMQHTLEQTTVIDRLAKEAIKEAADSLMEPGAGK